MELPLLLLLLLIVLICFWAICDGFATSFRSGLITLTVVCFLFGQQVLAAVALVLVFMTYLYNIEK